MVAPRSPAARAGAFPLGCTDADLRRLAAASIFAEADAWQRAQHVLEAKTGVDGNGRAFLSGRVLGTWQRADEVIVNAAGQIPQARCSCGTAGPGELCRHAVTLLLHWLRQPTLFKVDTPAAPDLNDEYDPYYDEFADEDLDLEEADEAASVITSKQQLVRLLMDDQMTHLRRIARERGVRAAAKTKADLVEQLADALGDPENIGSALARLGTAESEVLVLADLLSAAERATVQDISRALGAFRGEASRKQGERARPQTGSGEEAASALTRLADLGLLMPRSSPASGMPVYVVPAGVTSGLRARPDLVPASPSTPAAPAAPKPALGLVEVMRVIVDGVRRRDIGQKLAIVTAQPQRTAQAWMTEAVEGAAPPRAGGKQKPDRWGQRAKQQTMRLRPMPSPFTVADQLTLVERTGAPVALIEFATRCLLTMGALGFETVEPNTRLMANDEPLQHLFTRPPLEQLLSLTTLWLELPETLEFLSLLGPAGTAEVGPLEFRYTTEPYTRWAPAPAGTVPARRLISRLIGRLAPAGSNDGAADWNQRACWYDLDALLEVFWRLAPGLLATGSYTGYGAYGFWEPATSRFLKLEQRNHWERLWKPLVTAMLTGAMTWLRLVEIAFGPDKALAFRPRPEASVLAGRAPAQMTSPRVRPVAFEIDGAGDLCATVPPGYPDAAIHALFAEWGEMAGASAQGLRYRLHLPGIHRSFQQGMTGAEMLEILARYAGGPLPPDVEALLSRWADAYGAVRLYDDLTLLQVNDDYLLRELLATTSLSTAVLHTFSSRLVAVDPARVDELAAELTRLGHSPRVLEDA